MDCKNEGTNFEYFNMDGEGTNFVVRIYLLVG